MRALAWVLLLSQPAHAFSIGSAFADPCHERITVEALRDTSFDFSDTDAQRPLKSEAELRLAGWFLERLGEAAIAPPPVDERVLNSFLVGVRRPDVEGWALRDLASIRSLQLDLDGQSAHFLRAQRDEGTEGNASAIAESRAYMLALIDSSRLSWVVGADLLNVPTWVEHYADVNVPVIEAAYLLAQALHALQDSFSHTYRTEDVRRINVVMTYLGAFNPDWVERTHGPQHSVVLDRCELPENAAAVAAATQASHELMVAVEQYWRSGNRTEVDAVLDRWLSLTPDCNVDNGYCASPTPRIIENEKARGCSASAGAFVLLGALLLISRRRRFH